MLFFADNDKEANLLKPLFLDSIMSRKKKIRERGKIKFSEYFKELKPGEKVALKAEQSLNASFPKRMQGRTGKVVEKRGKNSYLVKAKDLEKEKLFIVPAIHLKRINSGGKK